MRLKRLQDIFIGAAIMGVLISISVAIIVKIPVAPYPSIIQTNRIVIWEPIAGCQGDIGSFFISFKIRRSAILRTFTTYVNEAGIIVIPDFSNGIVYAYEQPVTIEKWYEFKIPNLEPGNYRRITTISTLDVDSAPSFFSIPFTVTDDCPRKLESRSDSLEMSPE